MSIVVTFIEFLINYRPWGSFMNLSVGNVKMAMNSSVTENKLNNQKHEKPYSLKQSILRFQMAFFWCFEEIYAVKTNSNLKKNT